VAGGLRYAFTDVLDDISTWLLIGLVVAGVMIAFIPPEALAAYGSGLPAMLFMALVGIPMYICATAATPIAVGLILAGVSPGTALVFLLAGPWNSIRCCCPASSSRSSSPSMRSSRSSRSAWPSYIALLEGIAFRTGSAQWARLSQFWIKIFAVVFGMGVVSGLVMAFQFGTNWSEFSYRTSNFIGPTLSYEVVTAFFLEAAFLGVLLFGRNKVPPGLHLFSAIMVAVGTFISSFWILSTNSWMHTPAGYEMREGMVHVTSWAQAIFNPSFVLPLHAHGDRLVPDRRLRRRRRVGLLHPAQARGGTQPQGIEDVPGHAVLPGPAAGLCR
jgi:hypothetical protein